MAAPGESYNAAFPSQPKPYLSHGLPFDKACAHHAENTFHASRIYIVVSRSISKTDAFTTLQTALGDKIVGVRYGILPHTPWEDIFALAEDLKAKNPDLIITLGAGSITDGVKLARFFLANNVSDLSGVDALWAKCKADLRNMHNSPPDVEPATIPVINVPTTLSGGEYTPAAAGTDMKTFEKRNLLHASMTADLVVLDPALTVSTPARFWLSTGMRGVDHCVEGMYGNLATATPAQTAALARALQQLLAGLLRTKEQWDDRDARLQTQLVVRTGVTSLANGMGASHGIGHQLGPLGVGHGETSCVVLPCVMRYNWAHGDETVRGALRRAAAAFWDEAAVVRALGLEDAEREEVNPGDLVARFVGKLGLPQSLGAFKIGSERFGGLADNSLTDPCTMVNPVKLDKEGIVEILKMAA